MEFSKDLITMIQMFQSNQCTAFVFLSICWVDIGFMSYIHLYSQQHLKNSMSDHGFYHKLLEKVS